MTDLASALAAPHLSPMEGRDVLRSTIKIVRTGDGLSAALAIEPREFHHGEKVYVVVECEVTNIAFPPVKDTDALIRQHVLTAQAATIVEESLVRKVLDDQAERLLAAKEAAAGITRLPYEGDEDQAMAEAHAAGEHRDLVIECPECAAEVELDAAGE